MRASTLRLALLLAIVGAVGVQLGRHQFALKATTVPTRDGGRAARVSWSSVPPGSTCSIGGHVTWQPGLLKPRIHEVAKDSDCVPD